MPLIKSGGQREKIGVIPMVIALGIAALIGSVLGLMWHGGDHDGGKARPSATANATPAGDAATAKARDEANRPSAPASATPDSD